MGMYPGGNIIRVTPTMSEDAYADADVLFVETEIPNAVSNRGGVSKLLSAFLIDSKDINDTDALFLFSEKKTTTIGTINETANISADNLVANDVIGILKLDQNEATSSADIDNAKIHSLFSYAGAQDGVAPLMMLKAAENSTSVYVSGVLTSATTPTYDADSFQLIFHIEYL